MMYRHLVAVTVGLALLGFTGIAMSGPEEFVSITGGLIQLTEKNTTTVNLTFRVGRWKSAIDQDGFQVLLGPIPKTLNIPTVTDDVEFSIQNTPFKVTDDPRLQMVLEGGSGFVYMAGVQPYGGTDGGSSTSEGTFMIVQRLEKPRIESETTTEIETGTEADTETDTETGKDVYHRFFRLLGTKPVDVHNSAVATDTKTISGDFEYTYRLNDGDLQPVDSIPSDGATEDDDIEIREFVRAVLALAKQAGLPTPNEDDWP
jgi:hypothetical protein